MSDEAKRIAELEARLAALEGKVNPPTPAPFVPAPHFQYDPTAAMSPPIRRSGMERYRDQTPEEALNEFRKMTTTPTLSPMVPPTDPPPARATTEPIGVVPGLAAIDAIAKGFADREKLEQLANLADVASKLRSR
jgi:hypothetical protein